MLSFFPKLYPDELLYSGLARYHIRSGNKSFRQSHLELFQSSLQKGRLILPNNLNKLIKILPFGTSISVENIIQSHTLYPFYTTFLTQNEAWLLKDVMKKQVNQSIFQVAKVALNSTDNLKFLRFCPLCLEEDMKNYGEAYWHRTHQFPSVMVCAIHNVLLYDSLVSLKSAGINYYAAHLGNCLINQQNNDNTEQFLQQLLMIARTTCELINLNFSFKGLAWLRSQYKSYLVKQKFMSLLPGGKFIFQDQYFSDCMVDFYGYNCLKAINPNLLKKPDTFFINCLLSCDMNQVIDRTTHILIIKFLATSIEDFFK
jgi:hypothetical protein